MVIGITGNSGSGKTSICKVLENKYNAFVIDADKVVKELSMPNKEYYKEIVKIFGNKILQQNREINKKLLASIIFSDDRKRELLNSITYKYVVSDIKDRVYKSNRKLIIIDAPLLIEGGLNLICDCVISVIADNDVKLKRICMRDNIDIETAERRLKSQASNDFYIKNSNYVIINNNIDLEKQANDIIELLQSDIIYNPKTVVIQENDLKILQFKRLLEYSDVITHAFTLKPLNFGSNDTYSNIKDRVDYNYESVCKLLKLNSKGIIRPYQTHTNNVMEVYDEIRYI